jgi:non-canonical poly(A) RNA polymerase PAPD5/7
MVTLYGSDTLNMLRSASESSNLTSQSSTHLTNAKKWQRQQLLELFKKNENTDDPDQCNQILTWFKSLPTAARYSAVSHESPLICTFIWQMFIKKLSEGEVNFSFEVKTPKNFDSDNFDSNFSIQKKSPRSQLISNPDFQKEKAFEKSIRMAHSNEYLDTLTIEVDLLADFEKFWDYMKTVSAGKAFRAACKVSWDSSSKLWVWDYPAWFNVSQCMPMAAWACASIERAIWMNYWMINGLDPVCSKSTLKNFNGKVGVSGCVSLMENLTSYFKELKINEKERIVGCDEMIHNEFVQVKAQLNKFQNKCVSFIAVSKPETFYPSSHFYFPLYHPLVSLYSYTEKVNVKYHQSPESTASINKKLSTGSDFKFIEFLINTPLDRAVTLLDIVIRKVLYRIVNAFTEKNALELIQIESSLTKDPKSSQKQKKRKNKAKNSKKIQNPPKKEVTAEEKQKIQSFIEGFLNKVIENTFKKIDIKEQLKQEAKSEGFQEVCSQKSKHRKQPQQNNKSSPKKSSKHTRRAQKQVEEKPETFPETSIFDKLHREIIEFGKSRTWKLETKIAQINKVLEKLTEIVCVAFTSASIELFGSYASGLAIEESDVDLVVTRLELAERLELEMACEYLAKIIETSNLASKIQCINTARIPVIKLEINTKSLNMGEGLINIDITFDDSVQGYGTHLGLSTLYLTIELQKIYPSLQYLVLVIKKLLYKQDLNSAYKGGLSSYSLVLWVAAVLNSMPAVPDNLGKLLLEFFRYFGYDFDPAKVGVNIMNGGSFYELENPGFEAVVTIDPVNLLNNTRMAYRVQEVLKAFKWAHDLLLTHEQVKSKKMLNKIFTKRKVD